MKRKGRRHKGHDVDAYCAKRMAKKGIEVRMLRHGIGGDDIFSEPHSWFTIYFLSSSSIVSCDCGSSRHVHKKKTHQTMPIVPKT